MKALIIDTSHEISYIILIDDMELIYLKKIENNIVSKKLLITLDKILKETNTDISSLKYIATSIGPGSFTGLRVGASVCKTLSYAKQIPLISYISLEAYIPDCEGKFLSVIDAKTDGIFVMEGEINDNNIQYFSPPKLLSKEDAKKLIENTPIIVSPDSDVLKEKFKEHHNNFFKRHINPHRLMDITNKLYSDKKFEDFASFNLLYLRGPNHIE